MRPRPRIVSRRTYTRCLIHMAFLRSYMPQSDLFGKRFAEQHIGIVRSLFILKIGHALNRSLLYRHDTSPAVSILRKRRIEKRLERAQIKFFSLTATQILSVGPMFKNAIAVTENRELRAFRRCIDRSILLLMGVPRPEGQCVVSRFENQRNRRREEGLNPAMRCARLLAIFAAGLFAHLNSSRI